MHRNKCMFFIALLGSKVLHKTKAEAHAMHCDWYLYPSPEPIGSFKPYHSWTTEKRRSHQLVLRTPRICLCVCVVVVHRGRMCTDIKRCWEKKKVAGGSSGEVKRGKNLDCYHLLPARPLRRHTHTHRPETLKTWLHDRAWGTEAHKRTHAQPSQTGFFLPRQSKKHPISVFLVYLCHW